MSEALAEAFADQAYVADDSLVAALQLAEVLGKPLLIEGEAGVGKTEVAKCLAAINNAQLIRLQCYEGLDAQHALYDWDYQRQLLAIQMAGSADPSVLKKTLYSDDFLIKRPLLSAIANDKPVVLLIDEIDRADEEFEALLLEVLSDFQISIPELGTFTATTQPLVILTSNGVRELSDALRRRCLYHYLDYPDEQRELAIIRARLPDIDLQLAKQLVQVVQRLRNASMRKVPGIAETLDWAASLMHMGIKDLSDNAEQIQHSLSALVKTREDLELLSRDHAQILFPDDPAANAAQLPPENGSRSSEAEPAA